MRESGTEETYINTLRVHGDHVWIQGCIRESGDLLLFAHVFVPAMV